MMNEKKSTAGNPILSVFTGNTGIIGVLVILCVIVALATDKFLTPGNVISVLRQISINTYIALGINYYSWTYRSGSRSDRGDERYLNRWFRCKPGNADWRGNCSRNCNRNPGWSD